LAPRRGRLIVIAGPSGVGKGSVVKELLSRDSDGLALSVSATTRPPRPTEVDGRDYHFVDADAFDRLILEHGLLEWAEVFGNRYGTPSEFVQVQRSSGRDVILEIDVQGAGQIRERVPEALLILLEPPSLDELARRLRGRGTESEERIERRLAEAARELDQRNLFDHVVVNDDLRTASSQVAAIIQASRSDSEDPHP
jgi:guanylate kinase